VNQSINRETLQGRAIAARVDRQVQSANGAAAVNPPALAAAGGAIQRLGGEPLRPLRGDQRWGATPAGSAVNYSQGIVQGPPAGSPPDAVTPIPRIESFAVTIDEPEQGREYLLSTHESYRSVVQALYISDETFDVSVSPAIGQQLNVGDSLSITLDVTPAIIPVTVNIELRRI
jgi:hypothetical protein